LRGGAILSLAEGRETLVATGIDGYTRRPFESMRPAPSTNGPVTATAGSLP